MCARNKDAFLVKVSFYRTPKSTRIEISQNPQKTLQGTLKSTRILVAGILGTRHPQLKAQAAHLPWAGGAFWELSIRVS